MTNSAAHKRGWQIAEVVFGVPLLIGIALDFFVPFSIGTGTFSTVLLVIGIILLLAGIEFVTNARGELREHHQPTDPGKPTTQLVTSGVYSFSRNPLYLGAIFLVLGIGLVLNSWWILLSLIPAVILCHFILVFPEERYLAEKLGEPYQAYCHHVRRFLGRKRT